MQIDEDRGPFSTAVLEFLAADGDGGDLAPCAQDAVRACADVIADDDLQLGLYLLYELHYGGLDGVSDDLEWSLPVLSARRVLEQAFEAQLRQRYAMPPADGVQLARDVPSWLFDLARGGSSLRGSIAGFVARHATREQVAEALVMRSAYQLKEADPHTWAIPRLRGRAKAALVEIQTDEYGGGRLERMHAHLFARSMRALGLDDTPNAYLPHIPALWLSSVNALSMFGLHRRLRGALCGHLAIFEMTSSLPAKRWVAGLERLGLDEDATEFFDEHVEADAVHEQLAAHDLCGSLVADEPQLLPDVLLGAAVSQGLDAAATGAVLEAWQEGRTALRCPLPSRRVVIDVTGRADLGPRVPSGSG